LVGVEGGAATATVVWAVEVPFALVAVRVYVVVDVGFTVTEPEAVEVENEPGVMAIELAFVTFQERVDDAPDAAVEDGDAVKDEIFGGLPEAALKVAIYAYIAEVVARLLRVLE
jgi:hypothetical protein